MRTILQNPQTAKAVSVGMIDLYNPLCYMNRIIQIIDSSTKLPISNVHIINVFRNLGTTSNAVGQFNTEPLKLGITDTIQFSHIGYGTITLQARQLVLVPIIQLTPQAEQLPGTTIVGKKPKPSSPTTSTTPSTPTTPITPTTPLVQPSQNDEVKKSKFWLWIALASLVGGTVTYFATKKNK